ncbi:MAG: Clp protease N-terminal domain-containing protein [Planctomycetia bacterium]
MFAEPPLWETSPRLFTDAALEVLRGSYAEAARLRHDYLGCEHLLLALAADPSPMNPAAAAGLDPARFREAVLGFLLMGGEPVSDIAVSPRLERVVAVAVERRRPAVVEPMHLFAALVAEDRGMGAAAVVEAGSSVAAILQRIDGAVEPLRTPVESQPLRTAAFEVWTPTDVAPNGHPFMVDAALRSAAADCWKMLPTGERTVGRVGEILRGRLERVLRDLAEDAETFGFATAKAKD